MVIFEIGRCALREHNNNTKTAIVAGDYIKRVLPEFYENAFNFGNGNASDMREYMRNNAAFCVWTDENGRRISPDSIK